MLPLLELLELLEPPHFVPVPSTRGAPARIHARMVSFSTGSMSEPLGIFSLGAFGESPQ